MTNDHHRPARMAGKTALVTGGGSGIGKAICLRLGGEGARVLVLDRDSAAADSVVADIAGAGGRAAAYTCDVGDHDGVKTVVGGMLGEGVIDILVNCAGVALIGNVENTSEADFDRLYRVNVKGAFNLLAAVIPAMKARSYGVVVNIASVAATAAVADRFAYSTTKGAILAMTYSIAKDYVAHGIRCNAVSPARVHTPFVDAYLDRYYPDNRDEVYEQLAKSQPIGRMGTPEEVAGMVAYLCSDEASFVTGTNFPIDGGFITLNS
ncbi:MAG TPA: SDR family oxidoreductase [Woeseiaceae bacterium]|nr:SDR family oxidoreductase [Woeseiaceae bacterium]